MKNILVIGLIITVMVVWTSCQNSDSIVNSLGNEVSEIDKITSSQNSEQSLEVVNGMLSFKSDDELVKMMTFINGSSNKQLDESEQKLGFFSNRRSTDNAYKIASEAKTIDEFNKIVSDYACFITINDVSGEKELARVTEDRFFSSIANSNGYFVTGRNVNRVLGDYIVSTRIENTNLLELFSYLNVATLKIENVKVQRYRHLTSLKTNCGSSVDDSKTQDNYRVKTEAYLQAYVLYYDPYPYTTCIDGVQTTTGYHKVLGIWFKTQSNLEQAGHGTIIYNLNNGGDVSVNIEYPYYCENDVQDIEVHRRHVTLNSNLTSITLYYSHIDITGISSNLSVYANFLCGS